MAIARWNPKTTGIGLRVVKRVSEKPAYTK